MGAEMNLKAILSFLVVLVLVPARSLNLSFNDDVLGLIVFKANLEDPNGKLGSWNEDDESPCVNWVGVKCSPRSGRVSEVNLAGFSLSGKIGRGLFRLEFLRKLSLAGNNFTGTVTPNFANLRSLRVLDLSDNGLAGALPEGFFRQCGFLRAVSLAKNRFSGKIPSSLSLCPSLAAVNFSSNRFSGSVPSGIWSLYGLRLLDLSDNSLDGEISKEIELMRNLRSINLQKNGFSGEVPAGIGSCLLLRSVDFGSNSLSGSLPETMQQLGLLNYLNLNRNSFSGDLPEWIGEMKDLAYLDISANSFSGNVPKSVLNLSSLKVMIFSDNNFKGTLPESLTGFPGLTILDFSHNSLTGTIPNSIGNLKNLEFLDLSENRLSGDIPVEIGGAISLKELRLEKNLLGGKIPSSIGNCSLLTTLSLSHNNLYGTIPSSLGKLSGLENVDLSLNGLTGSLPRELSNLPHLVSFDISNNRLEGELPVGGFFNTISPLSVYGNPALCGAAVNKSCPTVLPKPIVLNPNSTVESSVGVLPSNPGHKRIILSISALVAIGAAVFIIIGVISITVLNVRARSATSRAPAPPTLSGYDDISQSPTSDASSGKLVMFSGNPELRIGANSLLNKNSELGRGGFGAVYRASLQNGHNVAIKKLSVSSLVKSREDFSREVKKLGSIRHANLVTLEGYYWTPSLQLIISEYVSGGSLHARLHDRSPENDENALSWTDRFNIILGTAKSLSHLHKSNIIHYNIKSSNVLIAGSGDPKVADFGLAKLLPMLDRHALSSKIQSALGYMAPEFACKTVKITEKCDVYGFGVLILETVSGKRPVEYMEDDVVVLCDTVRGAFEEGRVEECVDRRLQGNFPADEAVPVMKLGLLCTSQVPSNRPEMGEVVSILEMIRCPSDGREGSA